MSREHADAICKVTLALHFTGEKVYLRDQMYMYWEWLFITLPDQTTKERMMRKIKIKGNTRKLLPQLPDRWHQCVLPQELFRHRIVTSGKCVKQPKRAGNG